MYLHFSVDLQGCLIFMCRFAPYVKNGTNCYGTFTYAGERTKTKKVWICYFMSWLDIPRFQKTTNTIYWTETFDQNTNVYMLAVGSNMQLLLSRQIVSKIWWHFAKNIQKQNNGSYAFTNVFDLFMQNQGSDYYRG